MGLLKSLFGSPNLIEINLTDQSPVTGASQDSSAEQQIEHPLKQEKNPDHPAGQQAETLLSARIDEVPKETHSPTTPQDEQHDSLDVPQRNPSGTQREVMDRDGKVLFTLVSAKTPPELVSAAVRAGADLGRANLHGANLDSAKLNDACLSRANLSGANLHGAQLIRADLRGANLRGADLCDALLLGANLTGVDLRGALLLGTNLTAANLTSADLRDAKASYSSLDFANLRAANLRGVDLESAGLQGANIDEAIR